MRARLPDRPRLVETRGVLLAGRCACCEFLIAHVSRHGKEPVWGALEDNGESLRLAARLGFFRVDALTVFRPAPAA